MQTWYDETRVGLVGIGMPLGGSLAIGQAVTVTGALTHPLKQWPAR